MPRHLPLPGTPVEDIDTPALLLDIDAFARNVAKVAAFCASHEAKLRPHVKGHKSPELALMQLAAGGTEGGVCVAKIGEAEAMIGGGIRDVLVFNEVTTATKTSRLASLARQARVTVAVDDPGNVEELSTAATVFGVTIGICVEVNIGVNRCGVEPGQAAVSLAQQVAHSPGLRFRGLLGYEGGMPYLSLEQRSAKTKERVQRLLDTREMVEAAGLHCEIVGGGGTSTWNITGSLGGITEVHPGRYCTPDMIYRRLGDFETSTRVLTTVVSRPRREIAIVDCGHKAIHMNTSGQARPEAYESAAQGYDGLPEVEGVSGAKVLQLDAEHGRIHVEGDAEQLRRGDKISLVPAYTAAVFNQHDCIFVAREGVLLAVWEIAGARKFT